MAVDEDTSGSKMEVSRSRFQSEQNKRATETVTERQTLDPVRICHEKAHLEALMDPSAPADTTTASACDPLLQKLQKSQRDVHI